MPNVEQNSSERDDPLVKLLENYLERLKSGSLNKEEKILLMEFAVKNSLIGKPRLSDKKEWMKYTFLGYYIYENLLKNQN
jgi:hypothetical protein